MRASSLSDLAGGVFLQGMKFFSSGLFWLPVEAPRMATRFVNIDRDTPLLLPPDLRQWVPEDHLVHYILDAVESLPLTTLRVNERGTGSPQFPPRMMLGLTIYCYATGTFSSRAIERATYTDVAVRFLTGDTHPDHDTICEFRRQNQPVLTESFVRVLEMAQECKLLKFAQLTLAADGTKVLANASKHSAVSCSRAGEQIENCCARKWINCWPKPSKPTAPRCRTA